MVVRIGAVSTIQSIPNHTLFSKLYSTTISFTVNGELQEAVNGIARELDELDLQAKNRAVTGVLASHPDSRDVHIMNLSITFHGAEMLVDTNLNLNVGCRYGLIGPNGCGRLNKPHCSREVHM